MTVQITTAPENKNVPTHVAIIMDGNGRWAQERGLPRLLGHRAGSLQVRKIIEACIERGVQYLTLYAFSTENWTRPRYEVRGLMYLISNYIDRETPNLNRMGVRLRHFGDIQGLSKTLQKKVRAAMDLTRQNIAITVNVALNYGGRHDILSAIRGIIASGISAEEVNESAVSNHLSTSGIPEPDLVIRTSGEKRLSNFLIWETAYSELFFTQAMWPDFSPATLDEALDAYAQRKRRFGLTESASTPAASGR